MRGNEQITLPLYLSLSISPSLLNGGEETRGKGGEGERTPGPSLGLRRGLAVESKPLACLLSF